MEPKGLTLTVGADLSGVVVTAAELAAVRASQGLGQGALRLEWHFLPFERLVQRDPPLWLPDPLALDILLPEERANGDIGLAGSVSLFVWRATLGVYELHAYVDEVQTMRLATVEVRTNSPMNATSVLSSQEAVIALEIPRGHLAAGTSAKWLLFDMDSTMSTRRALLPIIRACEALAAGLSAWFAKHNTSLAFGLSIDGEAAGRTVSWADYPLGARMWAACNASEHDSLLALIAPILPAGANPKTMLKLELHSIGTVFFDPQAWSVPQSLNDMYDTLFGLVGLAGAASRTRALFVQGSLLSDHPAPSLRVLSRGSPQVNLDLRSPAFRRRISVNGEQYAAPLNLYVLAYADEAQPAPVAVFAIHTVPASPLPMRVFSEDEAADVVKPATVVGADVFRPIYDSKDKLWMSNAVGDDKVIMYSTQSVSSLVTKAAFYGTNTALAVPLPRDAAVLDLGLKWGRSSLLLTVEEREDPQLTLLLGEGDTWPADSSITMRLLPTGLSEVGLGNYEVERTWLFGRRIRAVEEITVLSAAAAAQDPFVAAEPPLERVAQSDLQADSELREAALKALNSVRLYAGDTDFIADTLPEWGRPYESDARERPISDKTLALDPHVTKYPRLAATAYPKQPSFSDATRAARAVEGMAKMTYEQWIESNPVLRDALFDPIDGTTMRASQVELDSYIKRLSELLEKYAKDYDPAHHVQASLVGGRLKDSLDWLRMLEANSGATVAPQWLLRPTLITLHPDTILERYEKRYPNTGLGWEARNDIREIHLPKVQGALLKMGAALTDQVSSDIRKWATERSQVTVVPSSKLVPAAPKPRPVLRPFVPRPGPGKPAARPMIVADPLLAKLDRIDPTYTAKLRAAGWSLAAQRRLVFAMEEAKASDADIQAFMANLQPVTIQPSPTINAAAGKALQAVLGASLKTAEQIAQEMIARREAARLELERLIMAAKMDATTQLTTLQGLDSFEDLKNKTQALRDALAEAQEKARKLGGATSPAELTTLSDDVSAAVRAATTVYTVSKAAADQQAADALREQQLLIKIRAQAEFDAGLALNALENLPDFAAYEPEPRLKQAVKAARDAAKKISQAVSRKEVTDLMNDANGAVVAATDLYNVLKTAAEKIQTDAQREAALNRSTLESAYNRADLEASRLQGLIDAIIAAKGGYADDVDFYPGMPVPADEMQKAARLRDAGLADQTQVRPSLLGLNNIENVLKDALPKTQLRLDAALRGQKPNRPPSAPTGSGAVAPSLGGAFADVLGPVQSSSPPPPPPSSTGSGSVETSLGGAFSDVLGSAQARPPPPPPPSSAGTGSVAPSLEGAFFDVLN